MRIINKSGATIRVTSPVGNRTIPNGRTTMIAILDEKRSSVFGEGKVRMDFTGPEGSRWVFKSVADVEVIAITRQKDPQLARIKQRQRAMRGGK